MNPDHEWLRLRMIMRQIDANATLLSRYARCMMVRPMVRLEPAPVVADNAEAVRMSRQWTVRA